MNTKIEIHESNTQETGTYTVWYKDRLDNTLTKTISENELDSLLTMRQKEDFFMGKFKFTIESEYDFKKTFYNIEISQNRTHGRLTDIEVTDQLDRFNAFLKTADLIKIGQRLCYFISHNAQDGRYTPYTYILRVLSICAKVGGTFHHPEKLEAYNASYRDILEYEALLAYVNSIQPNQNTAS